MDLISVIVPVYKVEPYLRRCVDSILAQTYTNLEVILVDDGSPDNCGAICDEYAAKDSRIKVIHQLNSGVAVAKKLDDIKHIFCHSAPTKKANIACYFFANKFCPRRRGEAVGISVCCK